MTATGQPIMAVGWLPPVPLEECGAVYPPELVAGDPPVCILPPHEEGKHMDARGFSWWGQ